MSSSFSGSKFIDNLSKELRERRGENEAALRSIEDVVPASLPSSERIRTMNDHHRRAEALEERKREIEDERQKVREQKDSSMVKCGQASRIKKEKAKEIARVAKRDPEFAECLLEALREEGIGDRKSVKRLRSGEVTPEREPKKAKKGEPSNSRPRSVSRREFEDAWWSGCKAGLGSFKMVEGRKLDARMQELWEKREHTQPYVGNEATAEQLLEAAWKHGCGVALVNFNMRPGTDKYENRLAGLQGWEEVHPGAELKRVSGDASQMRKRKYELQESAPVSAWEALHLGEELGRVEAAKQVSDAELRRLEGVGRGLKKQKDDLQECASASAWEAPYLEVIILKMIKGQQVTLLELVVLVQGMGKCPELVLAAVLSYVKDKRKGLVAVRCVELLKLHGKEGVVVDVESELERKLLEGGALVLEEAVIVSDCGVVVNGVFWWADRLEMVQHKGRYALVGEGLSQPLTFKLAAQVEKRLPSLWQKCKLRRW
ncbi:hypothetical protein LTR70_009087 [Exophiala xenobiotica]|uniref:Uncharacterized protein n=1 Tax=Lithohypha guttulata TaxID=1690604 RepID=A0ABR0JVE7_9EURO|nr:hypothetical protein LTR24_009961 [Lithohypha guttulata]KAK5311007.1 hypothetical protein LTR70_009087 [Exophiala xenobiotica]